MIDLESPPYQVVHICTRPIGESAETYPQLRHMLFGVVFHHPIEIVLMILDDFLQTGVEISIVDQRFEEYACWSRWYVFRTSERRF